MGIRSSRSCREAATRRIIAVALTALIVVTVAARKDDAALVLSRGSGGQSPISASQPEPSGGRPEPKQADGPSVRGEPPKSKLGESGSVGNQPPPKSAAQAGLAEAEAMEDAGKLEDALNRLERSDLALDPTAHAQAEVVRAILRASETAEVYSKQNQFRRALTEFNRLLPQVDPTRDRHLIIAIARLRETFEAKVREADEKEANARLGQAKKLRDAKKYKEATAVYDLILNRKADEVPITDELIQQAKQGKVDASTEEIEAQRPGLAGHSLEGDSATLAVDRVFPRRWCPGLAPDLVTETDPPQARHRAGAARPVRDG